MIKALPLILVWILYLCTVDGQSQHQSMVFEQQLSQQMSFVGDVPLNVNRLTIWSVQPGLVGWPIIIAGIYNDSAINPGYLTFDWSFPGQDDQSCVQAGRRGVIPCRGSVMERIFDRPSPTGGYNVSLSVSYPGQPIIRASLRVTVLNALPGPVVTRREIRTVPRTEWDRVIRAILELKKRGVYDHLTYIHQVAAFTGTRPGTMRNSAHRGPALLPWHRAFVRHMERAMQTVLNDTSFAIPYWDWSQDQRTGTPLNSEIWEDRFFGPSGDPNQNYAVPSGHFCGVSAPTCSSNWTLPWGLGGPVLERELGRVVRSLPTPVQVVNVLAVPTYDVSPFDAASAPPSSFRMALEGSGGTFYGLFHNGVHSWIGGAMASMASPNDPAFWIHHSFVDKLFTQWQRAHNCTTDCFRPLDSDPNVTQATPGSQLVGGVWKIKGHHWSDAMYPWSLRIRDVYPFPYAGVYGYQYDSL